MKKERAILNWRDKLDSLIPRINKLYSTVFDDFVKNGQYYTIFQDEFYTIEKDFKVFELATYSLTEQEFRKFEAMLMQIKDVSEKYIDIYNTRFYPELSNLIDNLIKEPSPIIYWREDFLNTNRVKILFDYCEKVVELISTTISILSNKNNTGGNKKDITIPDFKQLITLADKEEKEKFESSIREGFKGKIGKDVASMVCALFELKLIDASNRTKLFNAIRASWGCDIGSNTSINNFIDPSSNDGSFKFKGSRDEFERTKTKIQNYLKPK
jgi:hypothetical protein